jgi:hypothetical protein
MGMGWQKKIEGLKGLIRNVGQLWPDSTRLSGYGTNGPYHCGMCKYFDGGYCNHPVVVADPQVEKDGGRAVVDAKRGCCEFVEPK